MGINVEFLGGPLDGRAQHVKTVWEHAVAAHLKGLGEFPPDDLADVPIEEIRISGYLFTGLSYFRTDLLSEEGNVIFKWRCR